MVRYRVERIDPATLHQVISDTHSSVKILVASRGNPEELIDAPSPAWYVWLMEVLNFGRITVTEFLNDLGPSAIRIDVGFFCQQRGFLKGTPSV